MPKSRQKENFLFLKHILEESDSEKENDERKDKNEDSSKSDKQELGKPRKESSGPVGKYPVLFKKVCRNKGCQTRLSSFPLFPLPEESEWISDDEAETKKAKALTKKNKKNKSMKDDSNKQHVHADQDYSETAKVSSKVKNSDGTRKNFRSEHQLKETENPVLQAWLHKKACLARKQRKLERKERRAKKAALEEEARIKAEREVECDEKVGEWLKRKRKEARMLWRKNRTRVGPQKLDATVNGGSSQQPPPEYRVVRSFNFNEPSPVTEKALRNNICKSNTKEMEIPLSKTPIASCSEATDSPDIQKTDDKTDQSSISCDNQVPVNSERKAKCRPKTAVHHSEAVLSSRPKTDRKRPKTALEKSSIKTSAISGSGSPKKTQSLSYDEWLKVKRDKDKDKVIQKKRELIDAHLEAVIKELGKKRVEKIMSPRKQVDSGFKKGAHMREPVGQLSTAAGSDAKKRSQYRWILRKKPRPEPQGCDYPETQGTDRAASSSNQHIDKDNSTDSGVLAAQSDHDLRSTGTCKEPKLQICQEIDEKYNELKPSIEKVKDILDAEIKKLKESRNSSEKELDQPATLELAEPKQKPRPASSRPTTAKPASTSKPGSAYLTKEQAKKIASDLDVLGLCEDEAEKGSGSSDQTEDDKKSTVRENYFDYGSDVDLPTTVTPEFVK